MLCDNAPMATVRKFNTAGPVVAADHYCIPPLERIDLDAVLGLIRDKKYFVLHAPRQTGKTSALLALRDLLNGGAHGDFRCVYANVEDGQAMRENVAEGMRTVLAELALQASDVDDLAAAGLHQRWVHGLAEHEYRGQVDVDDALPGVQRYRLGRLATVTDAGVVDQDVDAPQLPHRGVHGGGNVVVPQHVAANADTAATERFYLSDHRRGLLLVARRHHDVGAVLRKRQGDRAPDAAVTTGNNRHLVGQVEQVLHGAHTITLSSVRPRRCWRCGIC